MIGMMLMTFMLFFVFVLNTGMLVNAKINLQNAADLAAYAGAATQARQLNQIGYLNYEMRRQYKKFLFRYYVMGGQAMDSHPQNPGAPDQPRRWQLLPGATAGPNNPDFRVPFVCIMFSGADNYCRQPVLNAVSGLKMPVATDAIMSALFEQLKTLEQVRKNNCASIADLNLKTLLLWLYNAEPELNSLVDPSKVRLQTEREAFERMRGVALGVGLVPREILLLQRIKTLASYVNARSEQGLNLEGAGRLNAAQDVVKNERAIQAFFSAYYTLGNHTFSNGSLTLDELLPNEGDQARLINLEEIQTSFQAYASTYDGDQNNLNDTSCRLKLTPVFVDRIPIGVAKDPKILTYYAIRLKARARVLFSPFGDVELKAYAAAQPFGSRVGPPNSVVGSGFTHPMKPDDPRLIAGNEATARQIHLSLNTVPNLPVLAGDPPALTVGKGWDTNFVIGSMFQKYNPEGTSGIPPRIGPAELDRAYQAAMVPNPWETQYYNIPTDLGDDPFVRLYDTRGNTSFWAPVFPADQAPRGRDVLRAEIDRLFDVQRIPPTLLNPGIQANLAQMKTIVLTGLTTYLDLLTQGRGENGEGLNVARLTDPFFTRPDPSGGGGTGQMIGLDPRIMVRTDAQAKTSWNAVYEGAYRPRGRLGYSVKFVSFDSLTRNKAPSNGSETWSNDLPQEDETGMDLPFIKH